MTEYARGLLENGVNPVLEWPFPDIPEPESWKRRNRWLGLGLFRDGKESWYENYNVDYAYDDEADGGNENYFGPSMKKESHTLRSETPIESFEVMAPAPRRENTKPARPANQPRSNQNIRNLRQPKKTVKPNRENSIVQHRFSEPHGQASSKKKVAFPKHEKFQLEIPEYDYYDPEYNIYIPANVPHTHADHHRRGGKFEREILPPGHSHADHHKNEHENKLADGADSFADYMDYDDYY